jgi:hypothetical protein
VTYTTAVVLGAVGALTLDLLVLRTALVRRRMKMPSDFFATVQTMSGVYVGVYFLAHMTAVFAARYADIDTNWTWLTRPNDSMLVSLSSLRLIAHYWVGPVAIVAHVACGLRMVLLQHDISPATANRLAELKPEKCEIASLDRSRFALFVHSVSDTMDVLSLAKDLTSVLSQAADWRDERIAMQVHAGIGLSSSDGDDAATLLRSAELIAPRRRTPAQPSRRVESRRRSMVAVLIANRRCRTPASSARCP